MPDLVAQKQNGHAPPGVPDEGGVRSDPRACADSAGLPSSAVSDPLRVLIVDDAASTRRFLRAVLDHSEQFDVVGEAGDGGVAIERAAALQPDLVLLDLSMPLVDGAGALHGILGASPDSMVIIVSGSNPRAGEPLLDSGAAAFVPKGIAPYELLRRLGSIVGRTIDVDASGAWDELEQSSAPTSSARRSGLRARNRAVVFDDDPMVRSLVGQVLVDCDVTVVAETGIASRLLTVVELAQPEMVLLDLARGAEQDASIVAAIAERSPRSAVVVYSECAEGRERALAEGAAAFVDKPDIDELVDQIRRISPGP